MEILNNRLFIKGDSLHNKKDDLHLAVSVRLVWAVSDDSAGTATVTDEANIENSPTPETV